MKKIIRCLSLIIAVTFFPRLLCAEESGELNVQIGEEIRYLDPQLATGISSAHITVNIFLGLYRYDPRTSLPVKALAVSYSKNADSSVWKFKLRRDVCWVRNAKGKIEKVRPVTAHDFVFSYRRMLSPELASEYAYMLYILKNGEKYNSGVTKKAEEVGVSAPDDYTLILKLEGSVPSLISYLPHHSFYAIPEEPVIKYGAGWIDARNIWCSGPFILSGWKIKERIIIEKNSYYPSAADVSIDKINFHFIGTYSSEAVTAFRMGRIDIDLTPPPVSEIDSLKKDGFLKLARQPGTYFVRINMKKKYFSDARVRRALSLALPRKKIAEYIMRAGQIPAYSFVPDAFTGYSPAYFTGNYSYEENIEEARRLMKEAGYPDGKGFPEISYLYNSAETHKKIAVVSAKSWKKNLGIKVSPVNQEWKVYLESQRNLDYDLSRSGWVADMEDPINFLEIFITGGGNNSTGFSSPEYDRLIRKARSENDVGERNILLGKADAILMKELPVIPVFNYTSISLVQKYIKGFYPTKLDIHPLESVKIDYALKNKR